MSFADILGQESAVEILQDELKSERINHAYLFIGKEGVGKKNLAFQFVKSLMCIEQSQDSCDQCLSCRKIEHSNHPDVKLIEIEEDSSLIKIDQIRELQKDIAYKPYEAERKIYIIDNADKMTIQAANSLLKTLEEPPGYAVIILLAEEVSKLLPTVISRCQLIKLKPISRDKIYHYLQNKGIDENKARLFSMLTEGSLGKALKLVDNDEFLTIRKDIFDFLLELPGGETLELFNKAEEMAALIGTDFPLFDLLSSWYRDIMIYIKGTTDQIINYDYLEGIKSQVEQYNIDELLSIINLINQYYNYIEQNVRKELALQVMLLKIRAKRV